MIETTMILKLMKRCQVHLEKGIKRLICWL